MSDIKNIVYSMKDTLDVSKICEVNKSFDKGVLRIAYHGLNRNKTYISKEAFENAISSLGNVPVVVHYKRDVNELGGHDMAVVEGNNGAKLVYATNPIGVVPSLPNYWWEEIDDNGEIHEYLCVDVLLWKRQEAYQKVKEDGVVGQSMEINIEDGETMDGVYYINSFIFTALCLLGDNYEPCFESASLSVFGLSDFASQYQKMLDDFKLEFANASGNNSAQIGGVLMEDKLNDSEIKEFTEAEGFSEEQPVESEIPDEKSEGEEKVFTEADTDGHNEPDSIDADNQDDTADDDKSDFALSVMAEVDELRNILINKETYVDEWGYESPRYFFIDIQDEEVIFQDAQNRCIPYGAPVITSEDKISIDFEHLKRKKIVFEDFLDGEDENWVNGAFDMVNKRLSEVIETKENLSKELNNLKQEYSKLEERNKNLEACVEKELKEKVQKEVNEVFDKFSKMLEGDAEFEMLKKTEQTDPAALEKECYSLYGKKKAVFTTSDKKNKNIVLSIDRQSDDEIKPYGNLFNWKGKE